MVSVHAVALVWAVAGAALALGAFMFARRYGGSAALETLERSNRVLTVRVAELEAQDIVKAKRIAELEASRDVSIAIAPVLHALEHHEKRAAVRSDRTLKVLDLIASRLGPDGETAAG